MHVSLSLCGLLPALHYQIRKSMHTDNIVISGERNEEAEHRSDAFSVTKCRASLYILQIAAITYHAHRPSQGRPKQGQSIRLPNPLSVGKRDLPLLLNFVLINGKDRSNMDIVHHQ